MGYRIFLCMIVLVLTAWSGEKESATMKKSISVMVFEASGATKKEAKMMNQAITSYMTEISKYNMVNGPALDSTQNNQEVCTSQECIVEIGNRLGVQLVINGYLWKVKDMYALDLNLYDIQKGEKVAGKILTYEGTLQDVMGQKSKDQLLDLLGIKVWENESKGDYGVTPVKLTMKSNVSGATVYIDSVDIGKKTPCDKLILPGEYVIRVDLPGYSSYEDTIIIRESSIEINALLEKATGTLKMNVTPRTAQIFINSALQDSAKDVFELAPGASNIEIKQDGYKNYKVVLHAEKGGIYSKDVELVPLTGFVQVELNQIDAECTLKGKKESFVKKWKGSGFIKDVPPGKYNLEVTLPGFATENRLFEVAHGETYSETIVMNAGETKKPLNIKKIIRIGSGVVIGTGLAMLFYNKSKADNSFDEYQALEGSDASKYNESFDDVEKYQGLQKVGIALAVVGAVGFTVTFGF